MGKTSPIVIPVTVDTTGVDRGLNNVRSRLTRGGGRGTGGGFGTGGNNAYGVGQGGSGGGVLSAALAGAVAGRAVAGRTPEEIKVRQRESVKRVFGDKIESFQKSLNARRRAAKMFPADDPIHQQIEADLEEQGQVLTERVERYRGLRRNVKIGMDRRAALRAVGNLATGRMAGQFMTGALARVGVSGAVAGPLGAAVGPLALPAAAIMGGAAASRFQQSQYQRFSNFQSYEGTPYYGIARRAAMGYDKSAGISWYDKMMMREKEAGGAVSGFFESVGGAFSSAAEAFGSFLGGAKFEPPKAWSANVASGQSFRIKN